MHEKSRRPLPEPTLRGVHHLALCTKYEGDDRLYVWSVAARPLMKVPPGLGTGPA
jgi:hypothetical protein